MSFDHRIVIDRVVSWRVHWIQFCSSWHYPIQMMSVASRTTGNWRSWGRNAGKTTTYWRRWTRYNNGEANYLLWMGHNVAGWWKTCQSQRKFGRNVSGAGDRLWYQPFSAIYHVVSDSKILSFLWDSSGSVAQCSPPPGRGVTIRMSHDTIRIENFGCHTILFDMIHIYTVKRYRLVIKLYMSPPSSYIATCNTDPNKNDF